MTGLNKVYSLTHFEVWALATMVYLPIDGGSILGQWLGEYPKPPLDQVVEEAVNSLEAKGFIDRGRGEDIVPEDLLAGLLVLALSRVRLTAAIQRNGTFTYTDFAQLEDTIIQFEIDGDRIQLHTPDRAHEFSAILVPEWFHVESHEGLSDTMPFGAFIMLQTALQLDTIKAVLEDNDWGPAFSRSELIDAFSESRDWVDVFSAAGIGDIPSVSRMPIKEYFDFLYDQGYLQQAGNDSLQLGHRAGPLRDLNEDPDRSVLTISVEGIGMDQPFSGALIHGNGRLFLLRLEQDSRVSFEQLKSLHAALGWASDLVARASAVQAVIPDPPDIQSLQDGTESQPAVPAEVIPYPGDDDGYQSLPFYSQQDAFASAPVAPVSSHAGSAQHAGPSYSHVEPPQPEQVYARGAPPSMSYQQPVYRGPAYQPPPKKGPSGCLIAALVGIVLLLCGGLVVGGAVLIFGIALPFGPTTPQVVSPQTSDQAPVWVVNNSNDTICYLYISLSSDQEWGEDQLGSQETIPPGGTWQGSAMTGGVYDLAAYDCADNLLGEQYSVNITSEGLTFTLFP